MDAYRLTESFKEEADITDQHGPLHNPLYGGLIGSPAVRYKAFFDRSLISRYIRQARQNPLIKESSAKILDHFTRFPAGDEVQEGQEGQNQRQSTELTTGWVIFFEKCIHPFWLHHHGPYSGQDAIRRERMPPREMRSLDMALCKIWGNMEPKIFNDNPDVFRVNAVCLPREPRPGEVQERKEEGEGYSDVDSKVLYLAGYGRYGYGRILDQPKSMRWATIPLEYYDEDFVPRRRLRMIVSKFFFCQLPIGQNSWLKDLIPVICCRD